QKQQAAKTATDEAIREAVRQQDKGEGRRREEEEKKDGREGRSRSEGSELKAADGRVEAKGKTKQDGEGGGREGYGASSGRRELTKTLSRHGVKSVPVDLSGKFAGRLAQAMKGAEAHQPQIAQHILNKLVQCVRIGINRKGEKEMQVELSERIFRGLKLRVIARGGKVAVHLKTSDARGKKAIEEGEKAIRDALAKKGIEVDEIVIS
ncbi:MAG TPA: hypothetical protein PLY45_05375, partial [bacterium]|nr:hypothetical protein [bacterium]